MSNPHRELSNKILKIIFLNLQKDAIFSKKTLLSQCALTCRGWRLAAQTPIFHSIALKNEEDVKDINSMTLHNCMIEL